MGLKQLWKIERKEVNRVRNGEGQGWHARQAHAEQNIGLIEKSALSIHAHSNRLLHRTPALLIACMQRIDIYLLSADDLRFIRFNQIKMFLICDLKLLQVNPDETDGAVRRAQMTANCLFFDHSEVALHVSGGPINCRCTGHLHQRPSCESTSRWFDWITFWRVFMPSLLCTHHRPAIDIRCLFQMQNGQINTGWEQQEKTSAQSELSMLMLCSTHLQALST